MRFLFGDCILHAMRRELIRGGEEVHVEPQVFDLLLYLVRSRERVVTRDDLLAAVWSGRIVSESTLNNRVSAARRAIGDDGKQQHLIRTVPRRGFRFVGGVREELAAGTPASSAPAAPEFRAPVPEAARVHSSGVEPSHPQRIASESLVGRVRSEIERSERQLWRPPPGLDAWSALRLAFLTHTPEEN